MYPVLQENIDYNIESIHRIEIPVSDDLIDDIKYRKLYYEYKENFEMNLLAKKILLLLNNMRIRISYNLGLSTLEYEEIKDEDYTIKEWEKEKLNELQNTSKKLSKLEHFECLKIINKEKQKIRDEKEKKYIKNLKYLNDNKKMEKKRLEAQERAMKVKKKVMIKYIIFIFII